MKRKYLPKCFEENKGNCAWMYICEECSTVEMLANGEKLEE